jgi:hypothetical protein
MAIKNGRSKRASEERAENAATAGPCLRVEQRPESGSDSVGPPIRIVLGNLPDGRGDLDLTRSFTGGIAHALWMARAGDDTANWVDAERILEQFLGPLAERPERKTSPRAEAVNGPLPDPPIPGMRRQMAKTP